MARQMGPFPYIGKIGNTVGQKYRGMYILRRLVTPTNPQTPAQMRDRIRLTNVAQYWGQISNLQRDTWGLWSEIINVENQGKIGSGEMIPYTGYTLFMHCNCNLVATAQNMQAEPPPSFTYDAFSVTHTGIFTQNVAGNSIIQADVTFVNNVDCNGNFGGVKNKWSREVLGRKFQFLPWRSSNWLTLDGLEISPWTAVMNTGLNLSEIPCNIFCGFQYFDQYGLSASVSEREFIAMV